MLTKPSLTLKRRLKATPAQVFQAWTDPEKLVRWFGPSATVYAYFLGSAAIALPATALTLRHERGKIGRSYQGEG